MSVTWGSLHVPDAHYPAPVLKALILFLEAVECAEEINNRVIQHSFHLSLNVGHFCALSVPVCRVCSHFFSRFEFTL